MSTDQAQLDAYAAQLDALGMDPAPEPLGWVCRTCEGRMTVPDAPPGQAALAAVLALLTDAARDHARGGCDR